MVHHVRPAALPILVCLAALPPGGHAAAADCAPPQDLSVRDATPSLLTVRPDAGRVHFVKDGLVQAGCPGPAPFCLSPGFVTAGDAVVVTATRPGYVCATFTGPPPNAVSISGWLPRAILGRATAATATPTDWSGDWQSGPEQSIAIREAAGGGIELRGAATVGARDPERVKRGAVESGGFDVSLAPSGGSVAFLIDTDGNPLSYDAERAKSDSLCALRLWRLGPYLVVADNLQCGGGGGGVTFTGVYRSAAKPS